MTAPVPNARYRSAEEVSAIHGDVDDGGVSGPTYMRSAAPAKIVCVDQVCRRFWKGADDQCASAKIYVDIRSNRSGKCRHIALRQIAARGPGESISSADRPGEHQHDKRRCDQRRASSNVHIHSRDNQQRQLEPP